MPAPLSVPRLRSPLLRLATVAVLAVVQLCVLGLSVALAGEERPLAAHVEERGGATHHGHDEATCVACVALHLVGTPTNGGVRLADVLAAGREARPGAPVRPALAERHAAAAPRAPPATS